MLRKQICSLTRSMRSRSGGQAATCERSAVLDLERLIAEGRGEASPPFIRDR